MENTCEICGKKTGILYGKVKIADEKQVCGGCWSKAGFDFSPESIQKALNFNVSDIINGIKSKEAEKLRIENFKPTEKIGDVAFDDNSKTFIVTTRQGLNKETNLYRYDQILRFELLEDGECVTSGGLASAVIGGVLFGGVGAIVGGVTGSKKTMTLCKSIKIKLIVQDSKEQTVYITFLESQVKKDCFVYRQAYGAAQGVMSALQLAVEKVGGIEAHTSQPQQMPVQQISVADEILKFKGLLDSGIITQEEFEAKKKQLLGL